METKSYYHKYSEYLKKKYGTKVYKLPINLPVTCPNRVSGGGCTFCAEVGTGFESLSNQKTVSEQLMENKAFISKKYKAEKFIAYFQNYTNTFMPLSDFEHYMKEAASQEDIVELSISTRPDCIREDYMQVLKQIRETYSVEITVELGLQTVNYHTLDKIQRGHGLAEYLDAVRCIQMYDFTICTHVILNLPWDTGRDAIETAKILSALRIPIVKIHSLYIAKNTLLCNAYENGTIAVCPKEEYIERLADFLEYLSPDIIIERLFSRVPEEDAVFSNWGTSWWKLQEEFEQEMRRRNSRQGIRCSYLNGAALQKL